MPFNPLQPVSQSQFQGWASFYGGNVQSPAPPPPSAFGSAALGQPPSNGQYQGGWAYPDSWANFYEGRQGFSAPQNQNSPAGALAAENYANNVNNPNDPNLLGWEQAYGNPQTILQQDQNWAQSLGNAPLTGAVTGGWENPEAWSAYYGGTNGFTAPTNAGSPASALAAAATISQTSNPQDNPALLGWVSDYGQPGNILANTPNWAASLGTPQTNAQGGDVGETNSQSWESPLAWAAFYGGLQGYSQPVDNTLQAAQNYEGIANPNDPALLGWELDYGNPQTVVSVIEAAPAYQNYQSQVTQYNQLLANYQSIIGNPQGYFNQSYLSQAEASPNSPFGQAYADFYGNLSYLSDFTNVANTATNWVQGAPQVQADLNANTNLPYTTAWQDVFGPPSVWYAEGSPQHPANATYQATWTYKGPGQAGANADIATQNKEASQFNAEGFPAYYVSPSGALIAPPSQSSVSLTPGGTLDVDGIGINPETGALATVAGQPVSGFYQISPITGQAVPQDVFAAQQSALAQEAQNFSANRQANQEAQLAAVIASGFDIPHFVNATNFINQPGSGTNVESFGTNNILGAGGPDSILANALKDPFNALYGQYNTTFAAAGTAGQTSGEGTPPGGPIDPFFEGGAGVNIVGQGTSGGFTDDAAAQEWQNEVANDEASFISPDNYTNAVNDLESIISGAYQGMIPQLAPPEATADPFAGAAVPPSTDPGYYTSVDDYGRPIDTSQPTTPFDYSSYLNALQGYLSNIVSGWTGSSFPDVENIPDITPQQGTATASGVAITPHTQSTSSQTQAQAPSQPTAEISPTAASQITNAGDSQNLGELGINTDQVQQQQQTTPQVQTNTNTGQQTTSQTAQNVPQVTQQQPTSNLALQSGLQGNVSPGDFADNSGINSAFSAAAGSIPYLDSFAQGQTAFNPAPPIDWSIGGLEGQGLGINPYTAQNANEKFFQNINGSWTVANIAQAAGYDPATLQSYGIDPNAVIDPTRPIQPQIDALLANTNFLVRSSAGPAITAGLAAQGLSVQGIQAAAANPNLIYGQIGINGQAQDYNPGFQMPSDMPMGNEAAPIPPAEIPQPNNIDWNNLPSLGGLTYAPTDPMLAGTGQDPQAFIMHHTGPGISTVDQLQSVLSQRGLGVEYAMDPDGNIVQIGGPGAQNIGSENSPRFNTNFQNPIMGPDAGFLNNNNIVGMEVMAADNNAVTQAQVDAAQQFIQNLYPNTPVFGHGEINVGHKEATEGMAIVNAINQARFGNLANINDLPTNFAAAAAAPTPEASSPDPFYAQFYGGGQTEQPSVFPQGYYSGGQTEQPITIPEGYFGGGQQQEQFSLPQGYFGGGQQEPQVQNPQGYFGGGASSLDYSGLGLSPQLSDLSQFGIAPPEFSQPGVYNPNMGFDGQPSGYYGGGLSSRAPLTLNDMGSEASQAGGGSVVPEPVDSLALELGLSDIPKVQYSDFTLPGYKNPEALIDPYAAVSGFPNNNTQGFGEGWATPSENVEDGRYPNFNTLAFRMGIPQYGDFAFGGPPPGDLTLPGVDQGGVGGYPPVGTQTQNQPGYSYLSGTFGGQEPVYQPIASDLENPSAPQGTVAPQQTLFGFPTEQQGPNNEPTFGQTPFNAAPPADVAAAVSPYESFTDTGFGGGSPNEEPTYLPNVDETLAAMRSPYLQFLETPEGQSWARQWAMGFPLVELENGGWANSTNDTAFFNSVLNRGIGEGLQFGKTEDDMVPLPSLFSNRPGIMEGGSGAFWPSAATHGANPGTVPINNPVTGISQSYYNGNNADPIVQATIMGALMDAASGSPIGGLINNNGTDWWAQPENPIGIPKSVFNENFAGSIGKGILPFVNVYNTIAGTNYTPQQLQNVLQPLPVVRPPQ